MNSTATVRPLTRGGLALIAAGVLGLLGWSVAPAQAGYYGDPYYAPYRCSYRCGYPAYPYYHRCYSCGCGRCGSRPHLVYERRYIEREYVERRYGWAPRHYHRAYGYYPYGRPFPWGYGGVRSWRAPYGYRYGGYGPYGGAGYEEPPRPPAPIWDGSDD